MGLPFCAEQLRFMMQLASQRTPFFDPIFRFLNYADTIYFVFLLLPIVWIGFSSRWGIRLFYLLFISMLINSFFKDLIGWPRPCTDYPDLGLLCLKSFGFPSGGAQTCMLLGALLIHTWRTKLSWIIGLSYITLISFSRLYLGVHYPIDILGGWVIGLTLFYLYTRTIRPLEQFLRAKSLETGFLLSQALPLLLMLCTPSHKYHPFDAMAIGLGIYLSLKYKLYLPSPKTLREGLLRSLTALGVLLLLLHSLKPVLPYPLLLSLLAFWLSFGASSLWRKISDF